MNELIYMEVNNEDDHDYKKTRIKLYRRLSGNIEMFKFCNFLDDEVYALLKNRGYLPRK
jgi:hypothetical protein